VISLMDLARTSTVLARTSTVIETFIGTHDINFYKMNVKQLKLALIVENYHLHAILCAQMVIIFYVASLVVQKDRNKVFNYATKVINFYNRYSI
jgi:hypothetical protein